MFFLIFFLFACLHFQQAVRYVLEPPLRELYFKGPRLHGYGFWNGLPNTDICSHLTNTAVEVWVFNIGQCTAITDRYFDAFYIGVYSLLYVILLYNLLFYLQQMSLYQYQYKLFCQLSNKKETEIKKIC
jgi:hypothetical protein